MTIWMALFAVLAIMHWCLAAGVFMAEPGNPDVYPFVFLTLGWMAHFEIEAFIARRK